MRCLNCRQDGFAPDTVTCPKCGVYLPSLMRDMLPVGTFLEGEKYRIDYPLGQGGFGITYRAFDLSLERPVAIKEFYPQDYVQRDTTSGGITMAADNAEPYQRWLQRFEREGRILARLTHAGIVKVHSLFKERETAYLVMELLQGGTLGDELSTHPEGLPEKRVVQVMEALVSAVATVHQEGVFHLDLKPDNVMVTRDGRIVLVDFGAARQDMSGMAGCRSKKSTSAFTMEYAPPELIGGQPVSAASDIFELGMMLHEMLTGQRPDSAWNRFMRDTWSAAALVEPWQGMVSAALRLRPEDRPQGVQSWWQEYADFVGRGERRRIEREAEEAAAREKTEQERRAAEERARQVEAERNRQQAAAQAQRETERQAEEKRRLEALEAEWLRQAEAARKAAPSHEGRMPVETPAAAKPAGRMNRRVLLLGGLGATGLGGAWLLSVLGRELYNQQIPKPFYSPLVSFPEPVATPLAPAANPSSFSFEVVTVNGTGEIVNREQRTARYFTEDLGSGVMLEMVEIPAGEFMMGSPVGELQRGNDESPQHQVRVPGFYMGRFTVTHAQWQRVMGHQQGVFRWEKNPVDSIDWGDAQAFCKKLSQSMGRTYRLPSEAEWEYACRAGTTTPFHFGETITTNLANYRGTEWDYGQVYPGNYGSGPKGEYRNLTTPVGSFPANGFGLHDMHGNVWEWCEDVWHGNYNGAPTDGSAWVTGGDATYRLLRGGSWYGDPGFCRSANRPRYDPGFFDYNVGFRVVISA
jgi:eukaryotic-like serine/threonine-protein kinase